MTAKIKSAWGAVIFILFIHVFHTSGTAGEPRFKRYSTENGLSHDGVSCILEDKEGFIWFGTWDGLNRYDGNKFVVYKSKPGDQSTLKSNKIREIVEDKQGYLWIKTYDKKVYRFDKRTEEFLPITRTDKGGSLEHTYIADIIPLSNGDVWLTTEERSAICISAAADRKVQVVNYSMETAYLGSNVNFILEDSTHRVWFGTKRGLICLAKNKEGYVPAPYLKSQSHVYSPAYNFTGLASDTTGNIFFSTAQGILVSYDSKLEVFSQTRIGEEEITDMLVSRKGSVYLTMPGQGLKIYNPKNKTLSHKNGQSTYLTMYEDRKGNIWLEPEKDGAVLYDPTAERFHVFIHRKEHNLPFLVHEGLTNDRSFKVVEDIKGRIWVSLKGGGFGPFNETANSIAYFHNDPHDANRLFSNNVVSVYSDKQGVLWFCTRNGGVNKATFFSDNFRHRRLVDAAPDRFDNEIRALLQDSDGKVWITNKRGEVYFHRDGEVKSFTKKQVPGSIYCITEDRHKNIWIGTKGYGLVKLEPQNEQRTDYKIIRYEHDPEDLTSLSSNQIYNITEDHKGRLWICTFQKGPNLLIEQNGRIQFKNINNSFKNYPKRAFQVIRHAIVGPDKKIWLGTTDGLLRFDPDEDPDNMIFIPTVKIPGDKSSLGSNDITYLFKSRDDQVWIGTFGGGLNKVLNKPGQFHETLRFSVFTKLEGLPNDIILSIIEDNQQNLWMATENGIAVMDIATADIRNYNTYNGLPKIGFSEAACLKTNSGALLFGGIDGYISFYPDQIVNEKFPGNMVFTGSQLFNTEIDIKDPNSPLKTAINYAKEIILEHDQDVITIEYTVLDYRTPDDISYAYILEGYDKDWHFVKNQKKATYTKIPPGRYTFRVKAVGNGQFANEPEKSISLLVKQPWWLSNWALFCYVILAIATLEIVRRIVFTMIRLKHKVALEKKIAELKIQFFTNISHELRTPLTLIVNPLLKLKQTETLSKKGLRYLDVANKNTSRMVRFVNQLLDFRKIQEQKAELHVKEVELVSFLTQMLDNFADIVGDKDLSVGLSADTPEIQVWCDEEKMDIVFFNILSNAVKFSPAGGRVEIRISREANHVMVQVCDEGDGVPSDQLEVIFEPYYEGGKGQDKAFKGTGIGLALSKDIMKLHKGTIAASINETKGMTFTITLLAGNTHFGEDSFVPKHFVERDKNEEVVASTEMSPEEIESGTQLPKLLLVEDNPELRRFITEEFQTTYTVAEATNGREGYEKARAWLPDIIISDVMMPETDGIQMLEMIKDDVETSHIPFVLLTAKSAVEDQIKGLSYGADFYITKPFHIDYVRHLLQNLLKSRQQMVAAMVDKQTILKLEPTEVVITSKDETFLREVIQIVETQMSDTSFTIDVAVNAMAMGRTTFYKKLKSLTNMSPVEFIRDIRLKRAKQLLDTGELTVTEVAYKVGFNSSGYFSTCFKEMYQVSPSDYLKKKG